MAPAAIASAAGPIDPHDAGDQHEGMGQSDTKDLLQGKAYTASAFALPVKIRPPDALSGGVQHESLGYRWIQLNHRHVPNTPVYTGSGWITLESATVATPSAAKTLANLRTTPQVQFGPVKSVRVAGYAGKSFDALITGVDVTKYCKANKSLCSPGTRSRRSR